jgi:hypothetical protein
MTPLYNSEAGLLLGSAPVSHDLACDWTTRGGWNVISCYCAPGGTANLGCLYLVRVGGDVGQNGTGPNGKCIK